MDATKETISKRILRLNQQLQSPYSQGGTAVNSTLNSESLQDALLALYDECSSDKLKKRQDVANFLEKFGDAVSELKKLRVRRSDFEIKAMIGRGHFGEVSLVKERGTGYYYAMKTLPKKCSQGQREASSYKEERDILALAARPGAPEWLTALKYAFQDANSLYLVMEYLPGGDMLGLLDRFDGNLPEESVKFYLAEVIMALNSLHQLGYVHRDVKPDNVLLDRCGHVKLADFGSAAKLDARGKVSSPLPVGTPEYIAPEVLQSVTGEKSSYGVECDYWSLGILAYELVFGTTPFQGAERTHIYNNIITHESGEQLEFPSGSVASQHMKALISGLLEPASARYTFVQVKRHSFFRGISWETLRDSVPPYVPVVQGEGDVSNFAEQVSEMGASRLELDVDEFRSKQAEGFSGRQLPFVGFTLTPGVISKTVEPKKFEEDITIVKEIIPSKTAEHSDIVRSREIKALREMLKDRDERLEKASAERRQAETKVDLAVLKATNYRQLIEKEREERNEIDKKAVEFIKCTQVKWKTKYEQQILELSVELQKMQSKCSQEKARAADLEGRLKSREEQLTAERENSDRLQTLLQKRKGDMTRARRETLTCMGDAQQVAELRIKLGVEEADKKVLQEKCDLLTRQAAQLLEEIKRNGEEEAQQYKRTGLIETELKATQDKLDSVKTRLGQELQDHKDTRAQLAGAKSELSNSILLLERTREDSAREDASVASLQDQLAQKEEQVLDLVQQLDDARSKQEEHESKVECLEKVLGQVESRIEKLEEEKQAAETAVNTITRASLGGNNAGEIAVLQAQLERLESQLEKAREAAVLDRQAARTAQTDLYKKEKELSDARIDIRIVRRELKNVEEEVSTFRAEKEMLTRNLADAEGKVSDLTSQLNTTKLDLETTKSSLNRVESEAQMLKEREDEIKKRTLDQAKQLSAAEARSSEKSELVSKLQQSVNALRQEAEDARNQARSSASELIQIKSQLNSLQQNNCGLREMCTMLDEQLEDSDKVRSAYETQLSNLKQDKLQLQERLEKAEGDLRAKTVEVEEIRMLRGAVEERLTAARKDADFQSSEAKEEINEMKQQLLAARMQSEQLLLQVNELESTLCESDRESREQRHVVEAMQAKCASLQEEIANTLTDLQSAREAAETLSVRLEASRIKERDVASRLSEAEARAQEEHAANEERILKLQATIAQQTKLIDFLQTKQVVKKKKTIADVLFGSRPKENIAPSPSPLRPAGQTPMSIQAAKERARTWEPRSTDRSNTNVGRTLVKNMQTPVSSKIASRIPESTKKSQEEPPKATEAKASAVAVSASAPIILDQRVLPEYCRLTINCALTLSQQVILLGAEEGLYSLHPRASGFQLVQIAGVTRVKQVVIASHLGLALIISGSPATLSQCELRGLTVAAEAAQCSKPNVTLQTVEHAPDRCHMCVVSAPLPVRENQGSLATFLCVANPSHVAIMRWNLGSCQFEPLRLLATTHPTESLLFTPNSLLLVCDEVFEVDLQDFSVEDFLDASDLSLSCVRAALKSRVSPSCVAILDVTRSGPKAEPEFMLCLPEIAVFLDAFGHRSRPGQLQWKNRPHAFMYRAPVLFVQHSTGVFWIKPSDRTLCAKEDNFSSSSSSSADQESLPLSSPKLLGTSLQALSVVMSAQQDNGTALITVSTPEFDSLSLNSETENTGEEFSFTSSLENSLEEDSAEAANKKVQFA